MSDSNDPKHTAETPHDATTDAGAEKPAGAPAAPEPLQTLTADGSIAETQEDLEARLAMEGLMRHRRARRRKKAIIGGIVGAIVLVGAVTWGVSAYNASKPAATNTTLSTTYVEYGDFAESVSATGTAQPVSSVVVTPEVTGTIESVNVAEGDSVEAGAVLLSVKNDDLDKAVRDAELSVRDAKLSLEQSVNDYNSMVDSYNAGAEISDSEFEKASYAIETARNAVSDRQEAYDQAVANAAKRTVCAPASGSVVVMNAQVGASVADAASKGSLIQIADLSQMVVKVQVNEVDISKISVGQAAKATFSALPGVELDAQVTRISTVASSSDSSNSYYYGSSGVVTYDVSLLIPNPVPELKPGMTANVDITLQSVPDTLMVPASCVATDGVGSYVMLVTDAATQATKRVDVEVAATDQTTAAVTGDLTAGDQVLLEPYAAADADLPMLSSVSPSSAATGASDAAGAADSSSASSAAATE